MKKKGTSQQEEGREVGREEEFDNRKEGKCDEWIGLASRRSRGKCKGRRELGQEKEVFGKEE